MDMDKHPDAIAREAAEHFARWRGAAPSQRRARDAWLLQDDRHAAAYDDLRRLWDRTGELAGDAELQALKSADLAALRRSRRFRPQRLMAVAAMLVALLGGGYLVADRFTQPPVAVEYATALGERRTQAMPDGSNVVLNTDSAMAVRYSRQHRIVELRQGEAQFDVARDAARPFVVQVGTDTITALGTRFQVRREPDSTRVTLLEGSVAVTHGDERYVLRPNERAILSARTGVSIAPIDPGFATGWLDGWLLFRGAPLAEVIAEANRYSEQKLRLGDPRLADVELSGNFHAGDNASIADAASLILPVRVERHGGDLVLVPQ